MSTAQTWSIIGLLATAFFALVGVTGRLITTSTGALRSELSAEIGGLRAAMVARFEGVDRQFEGVDRQFEGVDRQFAAARELTDLRFDSVDRRFDSVDLRFEAVDRRLASVDRRLDRLESPPPDGHRRTA